jgi:multidrug resistance protein
MRSPLFIVISTVFIDLLGFGLVIPIQPFFAEHFGASELQVTGLITIYALMQFVFAPLWGRLSDRIGRRPVLLATILFTACTTIATGLSRSLLLLYVARALAGIGAANISTAQAYVADVTPPESRAKGMGLIGASFGLGFILGPALGGLLASDQLHLAVQALLSEAVGAEAAGLLLPTRYSLPFWTAGLLSACNFLLATVRLPESLAPEERRQNEAKQPWPGALLLRTLRAPVTGGVILLYGLMVLAWANMEATFALITERNLGYAERENGLLFAYIGVWIVIMQGLAIGPLTRRFGEARLLVAGQALVALGFVAVAMAKVLPVLLVGVTLNAIGNGLNVPSFNAVVSRLTPPQDQGLAMGAMQAAGSLARVAGPVWGGWIMGALGATFLGPGAPMVLASILLALCALAALRMRKQLSRSLSAARG